MIYVTNAFSLNMLGDTIGVNAEIRPCSTDTVKLALAVSEGDWTTCFGHDDIARTASVLLGRDIVAQRSTVTLDMDDTVYVLQYSGDRLPEGTTELPANAKIRWFAVDISPLED